MYSDLLTRALGKGQEGHRSDDLLLADLVDSRVRLHVTGTAGLPVAEALARELSFKRRTKSKLCKSLEVRATPEWSDSPRREPGAAGARASAPRHPASPLQLQDA